MTVRLMKGNDAAVYGALLGGATHFFGYPITPASEITHAAALLFPKTGRAFLQAECEVSAINMLYGAAAAGARTMTSTSGPGLSLMCEGLSYMAGAEMPCVVIDVQRAGPGLGNIWPEQSDYNMVCKGSGHGNFHNLVLAPFSAQEMCDFTRKAFELADRYRATVCILADAYTGQMMEPVRLPATVRSGERKDWAIYGDRESRKNLVTSILMRTDEMRDLNIRLIEKYERAKAEIVDFEEYETEDAEILFVAFGICARICLTAVRELREQGVKVGMLRPRTLFPFPSERLRALSGRVKKMAVVELNSGHMAVDVEAAVKYAVPVLRYNWMGGIVPGSDEVMAKLMEDM